MPIVDWVTLGLIAVALVVIGILTARQWKKLKLLDLDAMPKAKLRSRKYALLEERLQRKLLTSKEKARELFVPIKVQLGKRWEGLHQRLLALEKKYRHEATPPQTQEEREKTRQKVAALLIQGTQVFEAGNDSEAEQIFLDIIRLHPTQVEAYEYLGEIYFRKKEYDHAIETLQFAQKLHPKEDRIHYDLGLIYQAQGNQKAALKKFQHCVKLSPNNPRYLDSVLTLAIEMKDRVLARDTLRRMKEANPENQKITEWEQLIAKL